MICIATYLTFLPALFYTFTPYTYLPPPCCPYSAPYLPHPTLPHHTPCALPFYFLSSSAGRFCSSTTPCPLFFPTIARPAFPSPACHPFPLPVPPPLPSHLPYHPASCPLCKFTYSPPLPAYVLPATTVIWDPIPLPWDTPCHSPTSTCHLACLWCNIHLPLPHIQHTQEICQEEEFLPPTGLGLGRRCALCPACLVPARKMRCALCLCLAWEDIISHITYHSLPPILHTHCLCLYYMPAFPFAYLPLHASYTYYLLPPFAFIDIVLCPVHTLQGDRDGTGWERRTGCLCLPSPGAYLPAGAVYLCQCLLPHGMAPFPGTTSTTPLALLPCPFGTATPTTHSTQIMPACILSLPCPSAITFCDLRRTP